MTRITRLVMQGFKSFARRTELDFSENFSIVLGPNGSGKSNVLDALCFVLGRMSSKSLRTEKLAHLIYNGGKTKEPANRAEVSIFFDNADKVFPVDTPELKVSRFIKANGQSVYKLNGETRTRQEVLEMLGMARIDPDGHNIILQGDIISFVEMSAESRRQLVEEVAGIAVYEERKKKALGELERVDSRLREGDILLSERKTHLKELRKDRDQALRYKEVSDKITQHKATYVHLQIQSREAKKQEMETQIAAHNAHIDKLRKDIAAAQADVEEKKQTATALAAEIEQKGEDEQVKLSKGIEQIRVDIGTAKNRLELVSSELGKIVLRREQLGTDRAELERKIETLETSRAALAQQRTEQEASLAKIDQSIAELTKDDSLSSVAELEKDIDAVEKELETEQADSQTLTEKKQQLLREKDRIEVQLQSLDERVAKLQEVEKEHEAELRTLKEHQTTFKQLSVQLNKELNHNETIAASLGQLRRKAEALADDVAKARARQITAQEQAAGSIAVTHITSQQIPGVYGTISQLGSVQSRYALAMEVAAGPRLNSIVVKDDTIAASCIRELKQKRLGTASFLPLNKIKAAPHAKPPEGTGIVGMAIDLVSFDARFKNAFSYVFGNTVVVDTINVARRIGIGQHRMATVDGDLAELSGAMHGGWRKTKGGAFQTRDSAHHLEALEAQYAKATHEIADLETARSTSEQLIARLRGEKAGLEGDIIRLEKSLHLATGDADASKTQEHDLNQQLHNVDGELEKLQGVIDQRNTRLAEAKTKRQFIRNKLSEMRNPAVLAELHAFQQKRQELQDTLLKLANEEKNTGVQTSQILQPEQEKINHVLRQLDKDEQLLHKEHADLTKTVQQKNKELKAAEEQSKKFRSKHQQLFDKRIKLGEDIQRAEEKIIRHEEGINITEVKLTNIATKSAELAGELAALREESQQYTDVALLKGVTEEQLKADISRFERSAAQMGNVNMKALEIYGQVEAQYHALLEKKEKLEQEKNDVVAMMNEIEGKKSELFMNTFNALNERFTRIFSQISVKGQAYLFLENEEKPFEGGLRVNVRITGNKFMDIRSLSGGEKTMTALAFIFAIQEYEPASFYVLDEVDAALDKKNSEKLAELVASYAAKAQYIVISHNDAVIATGNTLYGVSMDEHGMSNVVSLKM